MLSRWIRTWYGAVLQPLLTLLARLGITANMLTVTSLGVVLLASVLFALDHLIWGAWILLFAGFLDGIDGALAHFTDLNPALGGFLDSICDHLGDFAIALGLVLSAIRREASFDVVLIVVALFFSVFGSHVRSRAGMLGIDLKTIGIFTRCERIFILVVGILISRLTVALWVLAIFNSFSALQRVIHTLRAARTSSDLKDLAYRRAS